MSNPIVSIIVPNYNHAEYLICRLESIFNQTFQQYEVILLDDCSTDNSADILKLYSDRPQVSCLILNKQNSGSPFLQWKKGIELAKGEFIWIAESDDWCEASFLETLVPEMKNNPEVVLGFVQSYYMVGNNVIKWISIKNELQHITSGNEFIRKNLLKGNAIYNASMAVFRRSASQKLTSDFTKYKFCGDWLFWAEIAKKGNVLVSGKVLNYFRNHENDVSGKAYETGLNFNEELQVLFSFLDNHFISENEFLKGLCAKFYNYRLTRKKFSQECRQKLDDLFFQNNHTKNFKNQLLKEYSILILRQKLKTGLNKISNRI